MGYLATPVRFTGTFLLSVASMGAVLAAVMRSPAVPSRRLGRLLFAMGWAVYGITQVLAGVLTEDLGLSVIAVRAVALATIAATALAEGTKLTGLRRLLLSLALLASSEALLAGLTPATGESGWYLAQTLSIAGGGVLAAWLSAAFAVSIQFRFVTTFVSLLVAVVALISSAMTQVIAGNAQDDALAKVEAEARSLVERTFDADAKESITRARILSELPGVASAVAGRDASLADIAKAFQVPGQMFDTSDFVAFIAPGGGLLAVSGEGTEGPTLDALDTASLAGTAVVGSALGGLKAGSVDVMGGKLVVLGAAPVNDAKGQVVGVAAVGKVMNGRYLRQLPSDTKQDMTLVTADAVVASTLGDHPHLDDLVPQEEREAALSGDSNPEHRRIQGTLRGVEAFGGLMPLAREDGTIVGALLVQRESQVTALVEKDVGTRLYLLGLAATLLALLLSYVFGARIARPIVNLTKAAERVRGGDLDTRVDVHGSGEVAVLGGAFNQMTEAIGDLTAAFREAAEEEFRLRSRLQTILQSMTDGVIAVDLDGTIVAFNREAERMTGIVADRALGRKVEHVLALEDPSGARLPLLIDGAHRESVRGIIASLSAPNVAVKTPVAITSANVADEQGNAMGLVAVVRDLTPEIEVERMKTEFLSNVSHELRTPLTPIKGYANLMIRREVPRPQAVGFLERIVESTDRLERIVGMLVDFSAMEAGRLVPKAVPMNLGSVVEQLMVRWQDISPKHRFVREGFGGLPLLQLDQRLVPRAIDELIDNAVKFSPEGGRVLVTASLDRKVRAPGSRLVRITVSDEGIGIAKDRLGSLGGGFVQVDASETREYGGLGLGLAYVRRIAESHGGYLEEPQSAPGRGSSFTIVLPAGHVDLAAPGLGGPAAPQVPVAALAPPAGTPSATPPKPRAGAGREGGGGPMTAAAPPPKPAPAAPPSGTRPGASGTATGSPEAKPASAEAKPASAEAKPGSPEAKPGSPEAKPGPPEAKPAPPEAKPARTGNEPVYVPPARAQAKGAPSGPAPAPPPAGNGTVRAPRSRGLPSAGPTPKPAPIVVANPTPSAAPPASASNGKAPAPAPPAAKPGRRPTVGATAPAQPAVRPSPPTAAPRATRERVIPVPAPKPGESPGVVRAAGRPAVPTAVDRVASVPPTLGPRTVAGSKKTEDRRAPAEEATAKPAPAKRAPAKGGRKAASRPKVTIIHVPFEPSDMPPPRPAGRKGGPEPRSTR